VPEAGQPALVYAPESAPNSTRLTRPTRARGVEVPRTSGAVLPSDAGSIGTV